MLRKIDKPWGHEICWAQTTRYVGKVLHIRAGHSLSLQFHRMKEESICVQKGEMILEVEELGKMQIKNMHPGDVYHILPMVKHRMRAIVDCEVLEVSTPELEDVVRLEDQYGRV